MSYQKKSKLIVAAHLTSIILLFLASSMFIFGNWDMLWADLQNFQIYPVLLVIALVVLAVKMYSNLTRLENKKFHNADKYEWTFNLVYILVVGILCIKTFLYSLNIPLYIVLAVVAGVIKIATPSINVKNATDF